MKRIGSLKIGPLEMQDYIKMQHGLLDLLPKKVAAEDETYIDRNPTPREKVKNLGTFYINRELGPFYCFLPRDIKEKKREEFSDRHFKVPENHANAKELNRIREDAYKANNPEKLLGLYETFWGELWSRDGLLKAGQIGKIYSEQIKAHEKNAHRSFMQQNELAEINKMAGICYIAPLIDRELHVELYNTLIDTAESGGGTSDAKRKAIVDYLTASLFDEIDKKGTGAFDNFSKRHKVAGVKTPDEAREVLKKKYTDMPDGTMKGQFTKYAKKAQKNALDATEDKPRGERMHVQMGIFDSKATG